MPAGGRQHDDGAHERAGERAHDHAREQQHPRIEPPAGHEAQAVDQRHGGRAHRGRRRPAPPTAPRPGGDRDHRAEPRAAGKPEQVGLGQRVPDHGLERRPAHGEAAADAERQQHARRAQVAHDDRRARVSPRQRPCQTSAGESGTVPAARPDQQAEADGHRQEEETHAHQAGFRIRRAPQQARELADGRRRARDSAG